jgi:hypothetical protein
MKIAIRFEETKNKLWYALVPVAFAAGLFVNAALADSSSTKIEPLPCLTPVSEEHTDEHIRITVFAPEGCFPK